MKLANDESTSLASITFSGDCATIGASADFPVEEWALKKAEWGELGRGRFAILAGIRLGDSERGGVIACSVSTFEINWKIHSGNSNRKPSLSSFLFFNVSETTSQVKPPSLANLFVLLNLQKSIRSRDTTT